MQVENAVTKTTRDFPEWKNIRQSPRQASPLDLLRELTAAIRNLDANLPKDDAHESAAHRPEAQ